MGFPDRVSYSSWMSFKNGCQWRWKLDVCDNLRSNNYSIHMDFGTSIHGAIEHYRTRNDPISIEDATDWFEISMRQLFEQNFSNYRKREQETVDIEWFVNAGKRIIKDLNSCIELRDAQVVYNEHKLQLPIDRTDGLEINFKGFIDMVIKSKDGRGNPVLYIVDFKSCSWGWDGDKRRDRDMHAQLFLYKHFLSKKFNIDPKQIRCAFVLLKKRPPKDTCAVEFFPVSAGPVSVQRALDDINSDITEMKERYDSNTFKKNRDACTSAFGDVCPYLNTDKCTKD